MAINKKLIFWRKSTFNPPTSPSDTTKDVLWNSIVFFDSTAGTYANSIWTHGKVFSSGVWGTNQTNYVPLTIGNTTYNLSKDGHTHSYLPLSGGTMSGSISRGASTLHVANYSSATEQPSVLDITLPKSNTMAVFYIDIYTYGGIVGTLVCQFYTYYNATVDRGFAGHNSVVWLGKGTSTIDNVKYSWLDVSTDYERHIYITNNGAWSRPSVNIRSLHNIGVVEGTSISFIETIPSTAKHSYTFTDFSIESASKLQTARTINGVSFDGSANITITASTPATLTRGSYLTGSNFNGSTATTWAVDATSANTASKIVVRDASGNFSAGTITASLSGNAATATTATYLTRAGVSITTAPATYGLRFDTQVTSSTAGIFPTSNNSNAVITLNRHSGTYDSQLGFSSDGNIYYRAFTGVALNTTQVWKTLLDSANYTTYAPTKTGTGASGTWGISITGNASTATKLASITTTFTGTYPVTFNVNGTIYSHTGITFTGSTGALTAPTANFTNLTTNYLPKQTASGLVNSIIYDNGTNVGIMTATPSKPLTIQNDSSTIRLQAATDPSGYFTDITSRYDSINPFDININNYGVVMAVGKPSGYSGTSISYMNGYYGSALLGRDKFGVFVDPDGKVGINTTVPFYNLDVAGTFNVSTSARSPKFDLGNGWDIRAVSAELHFSEYGWSRVQLNSNGFSFLSWDRVQGIFQGINYPIAAYNPTMTLYYYAGAEVTMSQEGNITASSFKTKTGTADQLLVANGTVINKSELTTYAGTFSSDVIDLTNVNGAFNVDSVNTYTTYTLSNNKVRGAWAKILVNSSIPITITGVKLINLGSRFETNTDMYLNVMYDGVNTLGYYTKVEGFITSSYYINTSSITTLFVNTPISNFSNNDPTLIIDGVSVPKNILKEIYFSEEYSSTSSIGGYFLSSCSELTSADLSQMTNVTSIGPGFLYSSNKITSIDLSPMTNVTSIGAYFLYYSGVKTLKMGAIVPPSLVSALYSGITSILVPSAAVNAYKSATYWADKASIISGY